MEVDKTDYDIINEELGKMLKVKTVDACPLKGGAKTKKNKNRRKIMKGGALDKEVILKTISHLIVISILGSGAYYGSLITIIGSLFNLISLESLFNSIYPIITKQLALILQAGTIASFEVAETAAIVAMSTGEIATSAAIIAGTTKYGTAAARTNVEVIKGVLRVMLNPTTIFKELRCALACTIESATSTASAARRAFSCASNLVKLSSANIIEKFKIFNGKLSTVKRNTLSKMSESITSVKEDVAPVSDAYIGLVNIVYGILTMYENVETIPDDLSEMEMKIMSKLTKAFDLQTEYEDNKALAKQAKAFVQNEKNKEDFRQVVLENFGIRNPEFPTGCLPCDGGPVRSPVRRSRSRSPPPQARGPLSRTPSVQDKHPGKYGPGTKGPGGYGGAGRKRKRSNSRTKKQRRSLHKKRRATHKMRRR